MEIKIYKNRKKYSIINLEKNKGCGVIMYILNSVFGIIILGFVTYFTYKMDEKSISKGKYIKGLYGGKTTIWSLPYYFSFILLLIFIFALFSNIK